MRFIKGPDIPQKTCTSRRLKAKPKPSVVEVWFPERHFCCTYYNDKFDLKIGDTVYVEGKLEGLRGRVEKISYSFKIKLSDYKRVIGLVDTSVEGELFSAGSHFIMLEPNILPYEQVISWFKAVPADDEEFVCGKGNETVDLDKLDELGILRVAPDLDDECYAEGEVVYFEIKNHHGRAIVLGSKPHEISFDIDDNIVSDMVCDCYRVGLCKHIYAALLQVRDTIKISDEEYGDDIDLDYFAAISKTALFENVLENCSKGSIKLEI